MKIYYLLLKYFTKQLKMKPCNKSVLFWKTVIYFKILRILSKSKNLTLNLHVKSSRCLYVNNVHVLLQIGSRKKKNFFARSGETVITSLDMS